VVGGWLRWYPRLLGALLLPHQRLRSLFTFPAAAPSVCGSATSMVCQLRRGVSSSDQIGVWSVSAIAQGSASSVRRFGVLRARTRGKGPSSALEMVDAASPPIMCCRRWSSSRRQAVPSNLGCSFLGGFARRLRHQQAVFLCVSCAFGVRCL
jgi:hypothetical protein